MKYQKIKETAAEKGVKFLNLCGGKIETANLAVGCRQIAGLGDKELDSLINTALDLGVTLFDHADIYGRGEAESMFGRAIKRDKSLRERLILQTKCGFIPQIAYDLSYGHIIKAVEGSLKRLGVEYIDILLLHKPDALAEPDEINKAFLKLYGSGKVKHFGLSNHSSSQIKLLQKHISFPLTINQLQFSAAMTSMVDHGLLVNTRFNGAENRDGGILDYCRERSITVQAWSPFHYGYMKGSFLSDGMHYGGLRKKLGIMAKKYSTTPAGIAAAVIWRHPADMQVIAGTINPVHLAELAAASKIVLERNDWYEIYLSAGNKLV
jgi:predicted oxidoreductase